MRPVSCKATNASRHAGISGEQFAPVIATSRPPGSSRAKAEAIWRRAASFILWSTWATAENGGFIRTTVGRMASGSRSSIEAAFVAADSDLGEEKASNSARTSANSLRARSDPASTAWTASYRCRPRGSSTRSPRCAEAAIAATKRKPGGRRELLQGLRGLGSARVSGKQRGDAFGTMVSAFGAARETIAAPYRRRNRISRRLAGIIGGLPIPEPFGVGATEGGRHRLAQGWRFNRTSALQRRKEVPRGGKDGGGPRGEAGRGRGRDAAPSAASDRM